MSEQAAVYHRKHAGIIGVTPPQMPCILLTGEAATLLELPERAAISKVEARFCEQVLPLGDYAREGLPISYEAQEGWRMRVSEWQDRKRVLRPWGKYMPLDRFAAENMAPALMGVIPLRGGVYLDALAPNEVPHPALRRSMSNTGAYYPSPEDCGQNMAQVHVVARSVTEDEVCLSAHLTTIWAVINKPSRANRGKEYLTIRYLGAPLLAGEIEALPPLIMPRPEGGSPRPPVAG
jgi:hypothetical protein